MFVVVFEILNGAAEGWEGGDEKGVMGGDKEEVGHCLLLRYSSDCDRMLVCDGGLRRAGVIGAIGT